APPAPTEWLLLMKWPAVLPHELWAGVVGVSGVCAVAVGGFGLGVVAVGAVALGFGAVAAGAGGTAWVTVLVLDPPHPARPIASASAAGRPVERLIRGNLPMAQHKRLLILEWRYFVRRAGILRFT
ncbi:MAG: hypothetical protein QOF37_2940, partial [Thermoleophilaceae bacterium]|nr:hypothetical protein [Thermoleophilaceae bacterium]